MEKVSWELSGGVQDLKNLLWLLERALENEAFESIRRSAGWDWQGCYLKDKHYFAGVYLNKPDEIIFHTEGDWVPDSFTEPEIGILIKDKVNKWTHRLNLSDENVHFFARTAPNQLACLEDFVSDCKGHMPKP